MENRSELAHRLPLRLLSLAVVLAVGWLAWLGWTTYRTYHEIELAGQRSTQLAELRGVITYLDEVLTMSARMAVATGDPQWQKRYALHEPQLEEAIAQGRALASRWSGEGGAEKINAANVKLVELERQAFELVRRGRSDEAHAIIFSLKYETHKQIYAEGLSELDEQLRHITSDALDAENRKAVIRVAISLGVICILVLGWVLVLRTMHGWRAVMVTNMSENHRGQEELLAAKERAEAATRSKSEFLANMSHEIRTPMTAILGFADLLRDPQTSEEERLNHVETIHRNGKHLLTIINDILDLSKVEAGKMPVERMQCSPHQIVGDVVSLMRVRADSKGLTLQIEYLGLIPRTIQTDPTRLRQVLVNLVGNAIKFTEHGGVRVTVKMVDEPDADEQHLRFEVIDTGIGMTDEQMGKLFQPFQQADSSTTRNFGGTGLGLTISKRCVELLGGKITASSSPGDGSSFLVTIATGPLEGVPMLDLSSEAVLPKHQPAQQTDAADPAPAPSLGGMHILLAEDGPDNQRLIRFHLKKAGAEVVVAENGQIALEQALQAWQAGNAFDLILMDMQMPVMDGYTATSRLREQGYPGPIMALTAHAMAEDRQKCLDAGCDEFATKPIDQVTLIGTMVELIDRFRQSAVA